MRRNLIILCVLILCGCSYRIDRVIDGDTIVANGKVIRLAGIDCPEMDNLFGVMAKNYVFARLYNGKVRLVYPMLIPTKDKYGRLLAYVYINGKQLNQELLDNCYCRRWK